MASSSVIGALRVNLGLDSATFSKGIKKSRGDLASFAAKASKIAAGLAATFATSMTAMGVGAANAGAEIHRLSQISNTLPEQFQGWAAGAKSVGIEQGKLSDILKDMTDRVGDFAQTGGGPMLDFFENIAPKVGVTAEAFRGLSGADALQLYVDSLEKANLSQADMTFYMEAIASDSTALLPLLKNGGAAMADYAARAKEVGAVMSNETIASLKDGKLALQDMHMAVDGLRNSLGAQVVPVLQVLAATVTAVAVAVSSHAGLISEALRTVAGIAAVVAAVFVARYAVALGVTAVRAMVSVATQSIALEMALGAQSRAAAIASLAVKGLSGALSLLKGALISTGIGALVVGAGYLVGKFMQLVSASGGFGEALTLLKDVVVEAFDLMKAKIAVFIANAEGGWKDMQAGAYRAMAMIVTGGVEFANRYIGIYRGAFGAIKSIWSNLPSTLGEVVYGAANITISGVEAMVKKVAGLVDSLTGGVSDSWIGEKLGLKGTDLASAIGFNGIENPFADQAKNLAIEAKNAFVEGFQSDTFGNPDGTLGALTGTAADLSAQADAYRATGDALAEAANKPMTAWQKLKDVVSGAGDAIAQIPGAVTPASSALDQLDEAGGKAGKSLKQASDSTQEMKGTFKSAFADILTGAKTLGEAVSSMLSKIADMLLNSAFDTLWSSGGSGIVGSILGGLGIGANANGTHNWRGGLTSINERGGEIVDLPSGTRIIPHDVSNRMVDSMGDQGGGRTQVEVVPSDYFDVRVKEIADQSATSMGDMVSASIPRRIQAYSKNPRKL